MKLQQLMLNLRWHCWLVQQCSIMCALCVGLLFAAPLAAADSDIELLEEQAMQAAVERVAPAVVQIETVGGQEKVGKLLVGNGPTTGLIVSEDGYIISSAFNFVQKPASILVTLPDGARSAAEVVATDHSRLLVLLRVKTDKKLPVPEAVPATEIKVGQWAIAVGRTFEGGGTNVSVGIVSAVDRIMGKALQTDAKISPSNYGGPLVDIRGRVLGVLVPMSPQGSDEMAGVEWYDGGIGFAVPLASIMTKLDDLKAGRDLHRGILGVGIKSGDPYDSPAEIAAAPPNSPAFKAGLKAGDKIVAVDGHTVATQMQVQLRMGPRYAGETVKIAVLRGEERIERDVELVDKIDPFEHAFLGILPLRPIVENPPAGIVVRAVFPDGPAAKADVKSGDRITSIAGKPVANVTEGLEIANSLNPTDKVAVELERAGEANKIKVELIAGKLPTALPNELPPAHEPVGEPPAQRPQVGASELKLPEFKNTCQLYVPQNYHPQASYGVVLWLHGPGAEKQDEIIGRWKSLCDARDLILVAPKATDPTKWQPTEVEYLQKLLESVRDTYHVDPGRIVAHGYQAGGSMAYLLALQQRQLVRAVAAVDAPLPGLGRVPATDPVQRLAIYTTRSKGAHFADRIAQGIKGLEAARFPVTVKDLGNEARYLTDEELTDLARWIDALDRL